MLIAFAKSSGVLLNTTPDLSSLTNELNLLNLIQQLVYQTNKIKKLPHFVRLFCMVRLQLLILENNL